MLSSLTKTIKSILNPSSQSNTHKRVVVQITVDWDMITMTIIHSTNSMNSKNTTKKEHVIIDKYHTEKRRNETEELHHQFVFINPNDSTVKYQSKLIFNENEILVCSDNQLVENSQEENACEMNGFLYNILEFGERLKRYEITYQQIIYVLRNEDLLSILFSQFFEICDNKVIINLHLRENNRQH